MWAVSLSCRLFTFSLYWQVSVITVARSAVYN